MNFFVCEFLHPPFSLETGAHLEGGLCAASSAFLIEYLDYLHLNTAEIMDKSYCSVGRNIFSQ